MHERHRLISTEQSRLVELEAVIDRGLQTFVAVGQALTEIRDSHLYRTSYATFDDYCRERWGFQRAHAHRLIDAAGVVRVLSPTGDTPTSERQARELVPLLREDERQVVEVWRELKRENGDAVTAAKIREAVHERIRFERRIGTMKSSASTEWYTPSRYVAAVREVLGGIDLDPASCTEANEVVQATAFYDAAADGLGKDWHGRVFMNPPYGSQCGGFVAKLLAEHRASRVQAAILLLSAYATDVRWFQPLWDYVLCFTDHRIDFHSPVERRSTSTTGSVFVYVGADPARFAQVFGRFGAVVWRYREPSVRSELGAGLVAELERVAA